MTVVSGADLSACCNCASVILSAWITSFARSEPVAARDIAQKSIPILSIRFSSGPVALFVWRNAGRPLDVDIGIIHYRAAGRADVPGHLNLDDSEIWIDDL